VIFTDTVVVVEPGERRLDAGDVVPDWSPSAVTKTTVERVSVQVSTTTETDDVERDTAVDVRRVYTAPGVTVPLTHRARVRYAGMTFDVVGRPEQYDHPLTGAPHHTAWTMRRTEG
jgi:hypothetical protein